MSVVEVIELVPSVCLSVLCLYFNALTAERLIYGPKILCRDVLDVIVEEFNGQGHRSKVTVLKNVTFRQYLSLILIWETPHPWPKV